MTLSDGSFAEADYQLAGGPSVLFDSVAVLVSAQGAAMLSDEAPAVAWVQDAFSHLKVIGFVGNGQSASRQSGR